MFLTGHALSIYALSIHPEGDAMASSSSVLQDDSWLSRADRALLPVERVFALLSGLAVFSLMFLAAYSVSGRKFLNQPLNGYVDYIEAAMPVIAFMGISYSYGYDHRQDAWPRALGLGVFHCDVNFGGHSGADLGFLGAF